MISCLSGDHSLSTYGLCVESPHFYIPTKQIKKSTSSSNVFQIPGADLIPLTSTWPPVFLKAPPQGHRRNLGCLGFPTAAWSLTCGTKILRGIQRSPREKNPKDLHQHLWWKISISDDWGWWRLMTTDNCFLFVFFGTEWWDDSSCHVTISLLVATWKWGVLFVVAFKRPKTQRWIDFEGEKIDLEGETITWDPTFWKKENHRLKKTPWEKIC